MKAEVLDYLNKCSGWLTALQNIHWDASSMSQHKLCDDIKAAFDGFRDKVAEIEQGINGNINMNDLKPVQYTIDTLDKFLKDSLSDTKSFYKSLEGDDYIGLRSECETFIGQIQQFIYLNSFCEKHDKEEAESKQIEEFKKAIRPIISESLKNYINRKRVE